MGPPYGYGGSLGESDSPTTKSDFHKHRQSALPSLLGAEMTLQEVTNLLSGVVKRLYSHEL